MGMLHSYDGRIRSRVPSLFRGHTERWRCFILGWRASVKMIKRNALRNRCDETRGKRVTLTSYVHPGVAVIIFNTYFHAMTRQHDDVIL
jgi:hypothetical protein